MVNIKLLNCIDPDDVVQICCESDVNVIIEKGTITYCDDPRFLEGVLATLMYKD